MAGDCLYEQVWWGTRSCTWLITGNIHYVCPEGYTHWATDHTRCINTQIEYTCPPDQGWTLSGDQCTREYTLELDRDSATIEPIGTTAGNGKASQEFTATVTANGTPKSGAVVTIRAGVKERSGYHDHHDANRPKGTLGSENDTATACGAAGEAQACITGTTNDNGQFIFSFTSSQVSGEHTLTATCEQCAGNQDRAEVKVMVEGLSQIPASTFYTFVGKKDEHQNNHNLTPEAAAVLWKLAVSYQIEQQFKLKNSATGKFTITPPVLHVNDASLEWGGLFDAVNSNWAQPHGEHRRGTVIDLRANNAPGAISMKNFKKVDGILNELEVSYLHECTKDKKSTPKANRHNRKWPGCISELDASSDTNRHYHVRLMGVAE